MPFIESLDEFSSRQDCPREYINGRWIFENCSVSTGGLHQEPPSDKLEQLKLEQEYLIFVHNREIDQFNNFKREQVGRAQMAVRYHNLPGACLDATSQLEAGAARIKKLSDRIEEIDSLLQESPQAIALRQGQEELEARSNRHKQMAADIMGVNFNQ